MLTLPEKLLFVALAAVALWYAYRGFRNVVLSVGRGEGAMHFPRWDSLPRRAGTAIARTLSQSTVFKDRPVVSAFHAFVFYGFVYYLLVNLVDLLKGFVPPHWFAGVSFGIAGGLFRFGADVLSLLILIGVVFFLLRRFVARDPRLEQNERTLQHEAVLRGAVRRDSLIVGAFILGHVGFRLLGEGFHVAYEGRFDPWQPFASSLAGVIGFGPDRLLGWHIGWWGALGLILAFLPYFPRSKHIHLFAAPVNLALDRRAEDGKPVPLGALEPLDFEDEGLEQYGAATLEHLRVPQLLDAYACIQCNRCSNVCPANVTGKALSPAALEVNKRYELTLNAASMAAGEPSPRPLLEFAISPEAVWACTTCGACMEVCPVGCEQMIDIVDIRRDLVMMQGAFPSELQNAFRGLERTGNPWGLAAEKRMDWAADLEVNVPTVEEAPDFEVLFWVGCAGSYDPAAQATTRAMARLLTRAGVNFAVLGKGERCTGDPARRAGNEYLYYQLASGNVLTLDEALAGGAVNEGPESGAGARGAGEPEVTGEPLRTDTRKLVVTTCPHCFNALFNDYPQLGGDYRVMHHTQFLDSLVRDGRLDGASIGEPVTYHDPCYLGRHNGEYEAPRRLLAGTGGAPREMSRSRAASFCCGAGGAQFWKEEEEGDGRVSDARVAEARATGAQLLAVGCPFCKVMLGSAEGAEAASVGVHADSASGPGAHPGGAALRVMDVAQLLEEAQGGNNAAPGAAAPPDAA